MKPEERDKIIDELRAEYPVEDLVQFNEFDLQDKLQKNAFIYIQYQDLFYKERAHLEHLFSLKERLVGTLYDKFRFHDERKLDKKEIEKYYIPNDKKMIALEKLIDLQKVRVEFFEVISTAINKMGWDIKNYLEAGKIL